MDDKNKWESQDGIGTSFQEYANMQGITYEAVRRQVLKHQESLEGHIIQRSNAKYLDDYAVNFLRENSRKPIAQTEDTRHIKEQLRLLHQDISEKMMISTDDLRQFISEQQELALLRSENARLQQSYEELKKSHEELKNKYNALEQECSDYKTEISVLKERIDNAKDYRDLMENYTSRVIDHDTILKTDLKRIGDSNDLLTKYLKEHKWVKVKDLYHSLDDEED